MFGGHGIEDSPNVLSSNSNSHNSNNSDIINNDNRNSNSDNNYYWRAEPCVYNIYGLNLHVLKPLLAQTFGPKAQLGSVPRPRYGAKSEAVEDGGHPRRGGKPLPPFRFGMPL